MNFLKLKIILLLAPHHKSLQKKKLMTSRKICRYCISITVIGFVYSGFQAFVQAQLLVSGKQVVRHPIRYFFDFSMDQVRTGSVQ